MSNEAIFVTLRNMLAYLYADEASARRVVADAGLDGTNIAFSTQARNNWQAILSEAVKTERLAALLHCVQAEYGGNAAFQGVYNEYLDFTAAGGRFAWPILPLDGEEVPAPGESPYKGLSFFDVRDAGIFFGRERLTAELVAHLRQQRFLAVVGASGSGKSSLVRAGLVPALQQGKPLADGTQPPAGCTRWPVHIITPTAYPLKELAASLTRDSESVTATTTLMDDLARDTLSLDLYVSRYLQRFAPQGTGERLLLVVDQFEELFTLCREKSESQAFIENLLMAAASDGQTVLVITLRADFYAHCAEFDKLRQALERQQKYIGSMSQDELRQAIEEPARLGGWSFELGLVDLLLQDVSNEPGALPLLSHALLETWQRRQGRRLTLAGYQAAGRVQGAIAKTADRIYQEELSGAEQAIARHIFLNLTELGEGVADTRRRVALADLVIQPAQRALVDGVLAKLTKAQLVITDEEQPSDGAAERGAHAEVAHEALIREWPQLRRWLEESRDSLRIQRTLSEAAKVWTELGRDAGALYSGIRLQQALAWQQESALVLTELEAAFLRASQWRRDWQRGLLLTVAVAVLAALGWLSWGQVNEMRYNWALQAVQPLIEEGKAEEAKAKLRAASALFPDRLALESQIADVNRQVATQLVQAGESLARNGDRSGTDAKFRAALALYPPSDTPIYVWVPAGEFKMGSLGVETFSDDEKPQHTVYLDGFWIQRTEVTNAQYSRCVEADVCEPLVNNWYKKPSWAKHPIVNVDWNKAQTYAKWVGGRLPTEAEWEKACRGSDRRIYPWGNDDPINARLNFTRNMGTTTEVGSFPPGVYGLYDMAGNVAEWSADWFRADYYDNSPERNPTGPKEGDSYTSRGGAWDSGANFVRCAYRSWNSPDHVSPYQGFRVVVGLSTSP